jgi:hypothetical protein
MQEGDFKQILGVDIPNVLKSIQAIEAKTAPLLAQLYQNRDKIDPKMMTEFDKAMNDIKEAKERFKQYGNSNNRS